MNIDLELETSSYASKRAKYYPNGAEQMDALWHAIDDGKFGENAKSCDFYTKLKEVQDTYPKG